MCFVYEITGTQPLVVGGSLDLEKFIMKKRQGRETFVLMILFRVACEAAIFFTSKKNKNEKGGKNQQQKWIIIIYWNDPRCKMHVFRRVASEKNK